MFTQKKTPLCIAIEVGSKEYVELLLSNKAHIEKGVVVVVDKKDINAKKEKVVKLGYCVDDATPLIFACQQRDENVKIVETLLKHKCNVFASTIRGFTPIHKAAINGHNNVIKYIYKYLIDNKYDKLMIDKLFNQQDNKRGQTAYVFAVANHHFDVVETLVQLCNVDANIKDKQGSKGSDYLIVSHRKKGWLQSLELKQLYKSIK